MLGKINSERLVAEDSLRHAPGPFADTRVAVNSNFPAWPKAGAR